MSATSNPEIMALRKKVERRAIEIAEVRDTLNRLNRSVRANIHQAVWQSTALFICVCVAMVGGLAYQTSVLNKRFAQTEKEWAESDRKSAERTRLSQENLKTYLEESERTRIARFGDLKQEVSAQRK